MAATLYCNMAYYTGCLKCRIGVVGVTDRWETCTSCGRSTRICDHLSAIEKLLDDGKLDTEFWNEANLRAFITKNRTRSKKEVMPNARTTRPRTRTHDTTGAAHPISRGRGGHGRGGESERIYLWRMG